MKLPPVFLRDLLCFVGVLAGLSGAQAQVVGWGANYYGQTTVPPGLSGVVAIAGGDDHALALKADGSVVAWGDNSVDQSAVPAGLSGVVAIAGGLHHSLAVRANGSIVVWGYLYTHGQTAVPAGLSGVVAVAGGEYQSLALKADGSVVDWGYGYPQGTGPARLSGVVAVACGDAHLLALKADGTVVAWGGANYNGETTVPAGLSGVVAIAGGGYHSLALKVDGSVVAWGDNSFGQRTVPAGLSGVVAIAGGTRHSLALKADGTVVAWGSNDSGQREVPAGLSGVLAVVGGIRHSLALQGPAGPPVITSARRWMTEAAGARAGNVLFQQRIFASGSPSHYAASGLPQGLVLNSATGLITGVATVVGTFPITLSATNASGTSSADVVLTVTGLPRLVAALPTSVQNGRAQIVAIGNVAIAGLPLGASVDGATGLVSGLPSGSFALSVTISNPYGSVTIPWTVEVPPVFAWGRNDYGQSVVPVGLSGAVAIATGGWHSLALKADGTTIAWGYNAYGQSAVPASLSGVVAIAAGGLHSLALKSDGTVAVWGYNDTGQSTVPAGLSGVRAIAGGYQHSLALKADGTVAAWGDDALGQSTVPLGLGGVTAIAAGYQHSLALKADGSVVAWGRNVEGQRTVPAGLTGVVAIAAGHYHSLALKGDGSVVAWGYNTYGQSTVPAGLRQVVAIAAGNYHSLALKEDGSVVHWGHNDAGSSMVPPELRGVWAIAAGTSRSLALVRAVTTAPSTISALISSTYARPSPEPTLALPQFTATSLPPGLSINTATGAITGSPTQVGVWQTVVRASNLITSSTQSLTFIVEPALGSDYISWSEAFGLAAGSASAPQADADGDGMSNLMEFALRTAPTLSSPHAAPALRRANDGAFVIELDVGDRGTLLNWQGEFSNNLNFESPAIVAPTVTPGAAAGFLRLRFEDPGGISAGRRIGRLRVTQP